MAWMLLIAAVKCAMLLCLALLGTAVAFRASAATRHVVLCAAMMAALVFPVLGIVVPRIGVEVLPARTAPSVVHEHVTWQPATPPANLEPSPAPSPLASPEPAPMARPFNWTRFALLLWAAGTFALLARAGWGWGQLSAIARRAEPLVQDEWQEMLGELVLRMNIGRNVALLCSREVEVPMTWGFKNPCVVVPASATDWSADRRRAVLVHELAHVERFDSLTQLLASVACAVHWPNPLAWIAARKMRDERERACDDRVLQIGARPTDYAQSLLDIARNSRRQRGPAAALAMACRSQLEGRLLAVLDPRLPRRNLSSRGAALAGSAAAMLALPLAAIEAREAKPREVKPAAAIAWAEAPKAPAVAKGVATAKPAPVVKLASKSGSGTRIHLHNETDDGTWSVSWSNDKGQSASLQANGKVSANDDVRDLVLSPGSVVIISVTQGGEVRQLTLTADSNGAVRRILTINGAQRPWDPEWFATFLTQLDRETGFALPSRFPRMLRSRGPDGVLDELQNFESDYAKGLYLHKLISETDLHGAQLVRYLQAAATLGSDYERANALLDAAKRDDLTAPETRAAFLSAMKGMSSDYEVGRVLKALLETSRPTDAEVRMVLDSARHIQSDYEKSQVLIALAEKKRIGAETIPQYLEVCKSLGSDYEHGRALKAIAAERGIEERGLEQILAQASAIGSDYERATLLLYVAQAHPIQGRLRNAYEKAALAIGSDYERGRALAALR